MQQRTPGAPEIQISIKRSVKAYTYGRFAAKKHTHHAFRAQRGLCDCRSVRAVSLSLVLCNVVWCVVVVVMFVCVCVWEGGCVCVCVSVWGRVWVCLWGGGRTTPETPMVIYSTMDCKPKFI